MPAASACLRRECPYHCPMQSLDTTETHVEAPRMLPSSFDPTDAELRALSISRDYRWKSLAAGLAFLDTRAVLLRLPLFWQVLPLVHDACTEAACTLFVNEKENMPLGDAAIRVGEVNTVITDTKDAFAFSLFCSERNTSINSWFVVHEFRGEWTLPIMFSDTARVVQEVHLSPGIPFLVQCATLCAEKTARFHRTDTPAANPLPDITLSPDGVCTCGKEVLVRR